MTPPLADWEAVRLYGVLSESQILALEEGKLLQYAEAPPRAREMMVEMAFSREIDGGIDYSNPSRPRHVLLEPTAVFGPGIPNGTALSLSASRTKAPVAYLRRGEGTVPFRVVTPVDIVSYESPGAAARFGGPFAAGYAMGWAQQLDLRLSFSVSASQSASLMDFDVDDKATPAPWTALPEPFPSAIREILRKSQPPPRR